MINGATTCPSSSAESGGVDCVPGAPRSAASAPCTVELTAGVPPSLVACARVKSVPPPRPAIGIGLCRSVRVRGAKTRYKGVQSRDAYALLRFCARH
jgi:hypothetical protein